jgi:AraC-like DNA-binding protein
MARTTHTRPKDAKHSARVARRSRPPPARRILAYLARERDQITVFNALGTGARILFADSPNGIPPPWVHGPPDALLVDLPEALGDRLHTAIEIVHRKAPDIPVWAYVGDDRGAMHRVVRLARQQLLVDVVLSSEDIGAELKHLIAELPAQSEAAALARVWHRWLRPETDALINACIEESTKAATVEDVARVLNKSVRAVERLAERFKLPPTQRVLGACRLLRATHRLDHRDTTVKEVALELGYPTARALSRHVKDHAGFTISSLPEGSAFAKMTTFVRAEMFESGALSGEKAAASRGESGAKRRKPGHR